jgi:hypothetical protein
MDRAKWYNVNELPHMRIASILIQAGTSYREISGSPQSLKAQIGIVPALV